MANTTFTGPVRSENGFEVIDKSTVTGAVTSTMSVKDELLQLLQLQMVKLLEKKHLSKYLQTLFH